MLSGVLQYHIPLYYLAIINMIALLLFALDKRLAVNGFRRISERSLLLSCIMGGSVGGLLGMHMLRHKTRHSKFRIGIPLILAVQLILGWYLSIV